MTREEAIQRLYRMGRSHVGIIDENTLADNKALSMAIEALPSADRPTVDKEYLIDLIQEAVYDGEACAKLIDLVDRPTGKWVLKEHLWECDQCGCRINRANPLKGNIWNYNFCPNCGAKMGGDSDG